MKIWLGMLKCDYLSTATHNSCKFQLACQCFWYVWGCSKQLIWSSGPYSIVKHEIKCSWTLRRMSDQVLLAGKGVKYESSNINYSIEKDAAVAKEWIRLKLLTWLYSNSNKKKERDELLLAMVSNIADNHTFNFHFLHSTIYSESPREVYHSTETDNIVKKNIEYWSTPMKTQSNIILNKNKYLRRDVLFRLFWIIS